MCKTHFDRLINKIFKYAIGILFIISIALAVQSVYAQNVKTYIPKGAYTYKDTFIDAIDSTWPSIPNKAYIFSLAEHESCIGLKHSRCFNPRSELHTARERGVGFGQTTIAYRLRPGAGMKDFSARAAVRFDALKDNKHLDPRLRALTWENIKDQPELQAIMMVAMVKRIYMSFEGKGFTSMDDLRFTDASYNAGAGMTRKRIMKCSFKAGCNKGIWFNNVERTCAASRKALYAGRSPCDINEHHVKDTTVTRLDKYEKLLGS